MKELETRDYQERIHQKALSYLETPLDGIAHTVLIESPTGSGKTISSLRICKWLEERGHKIGWIAHRRELLNQVVKANKEFFNCETLTPISMFTKEPEKYKDCTTMVVDECLPYDAKVKIAHNGNSYTVNIGDVVTKNAGELILSKNEKGQIEYKKITTRTPMGIKELWEITIDNKINEIVLRITEEGRILTQNGYLKVRSLNIGDKVTTISAPNTTTIEQMLDRPTITGIITNIKQTGITTETYDIGVEDNHNFFANDVLVHNCQHDASQSCAILHQIIRPKIIIGLTATPYRTDRAQLCFQKVIRDAGIRQLIREGYLAQFNQWVIDKQWTPENVASTYLNDPNKWGKSVIYFLTINEAAQCDEILRSHGISSALITGQTEREDLLERFSTGEIQVLCNVAVLTEGFDEPTIKTVFVRPGSKGPTVQMAGRALRKHPEIPIVNIVQNNETHYPFTKHARAHLQYMIEMDQWLSVDSRNLDEIFKNQIEKITNIKIVMPEFLKKQQSKRSGSPVIDVG